MSTDYPHTVASTWTLSFSQVEQADPAAADLLRLCAFLHPDAIPEAIVTEGAAALGPQLQEVATEPLLLNEAIQLLRRYSLVNAAFPLVEHSVWPQCERLLSQALTAAQLIEQYQVNAEEAGRLLYETAHLSMLKPYKGLGVSHVYVTICTKLVHD